jgi:hypothetical protein
VVVERPRVRTKDRESEVALPTNEHFASRDALSAVGLERMLADVSGRRYGARSRSSARFAPRARRRRALPRMLMSRSPARRGGARAAGFGRPGLVSLRT